MAKSKRVHNIAKELGVPSKVIVEKCAAEGVPDITNHMSVVKIGLELTIKQWFADEAGASDETTAVETAEKVDVKKVRKKPARKAAKKAASDDAIDAGDTAVAVAEPPEETAAASKKKATKARRKTKSEDESASDEEIAKPTKKRATKKKTTAADEQTPTAEEALKPPQPIGPIGVENVPTRPKDVKPAGEQLEKPKAVALKGPKVIRVEKADPLPAPPRQKRPGGFGGGGPMTNRPAPGGAGALPTRGGGGGRSAGRGRDRGGEGETGQRKRRSLNTRRGRSAESQLTGPTNLSEQDMLELDARLKGAPGTWKQRRQTMRRREEGKPVAATLAQTGGKVEVAEPIFIKDLSAATGIKAADMIKYLFSKGVMATINSAIGAEAAMEICLEYDIELEVKEQQTAEEILIEEFGQREAVDVRPRPPVVTVLGHVDHGKTSLLDRIRQADVAAHEAGGITQHVGAYRVTVEGTDGEMKTVVFLDTPGHEAFTNMRLRGAKMTDLVVLVVAADDGVMPQTIESINHAKAAEVPILVALNKIDLPQATNDNIQKILGQLAEHGLNPVDWGGDTEVIRVSATEGTGITDLLETLDYQAELLELKADYGGEGRGTVIEAEMQEGRGPVTRVLIQDGQVKVGGFFVCGRGFGRIRDMTDDKGNAVQEAGPATPLEISGIDVLPDAGDKMYVTPSLKKAEEIARQYRDTERTQQLASKTKVTMDNFASALAAGDVKDLRVVLKTDVQGSAETIAASLDKLGNDEVTVKVLHSAVGGVTESDVVLADASDAVIIAFNVVAPPVVREMADEHGVDVRSYRVIYDLIDDVKKALEGMLTPDVTEEEVGSADVREAFNISKLGTVAGCLITDGQVNKSCLVRIVRDDIVIADERKIESLRRVKDEVKEVRAGTECGIKLAGFDDIKNDDRLIFYKKIEVARKLE